MAVGLEAAARPENLHTPDLEDVASMRLRDFSQRLLSAFSGHVDSWPVADRSGAREDRQAGLHAGQHGQIGFEANQVRPSRCEVGGCRRRLGRSRRRKRTQEQNEHNTSCGSRQHAVLQQTPCTTLRAVIPDTCRPPAVRKGQRLVGGQILATACARETCQRGVLADAHHNRPYCSASTSMSSWPRSRMAERNVPSPTGRTALMPVTATY